MGNSSKSRFLSLAVIAVMSIALAACGGDSNGGGGPVVTPTVAAAPTAIPMSNADLLKAAAANMKAANTYHITLTGSAAGQAVTMTGDIDVAANKSNLTIATTGITISVITIMSDTYLSTDGGKNFNKSNSSNSPAASLSSFTGMWSTFNPADVDSHAADLKDGSPAIETIDGTSARHIIANTTDFIPLSNPSSTVTATATTTATASVTGTLEIWVSTDANPTVRQMKISGTNGGQQGDFTVTWSNINRPVTITAPPTSSGSGGTGSATAAVPTTDTSGGSGGGGATDMTPTPGQ